MRWDPRAGLLRATEVRSGWNLARRPFDGRNSSTSTGDLLCPLYVETCQCANSDRSLTVRKKNGRRPRSMSERLRNRYYAMFDTRPRRAFQAAAGRLHRPLSVDGEPVSRSKPPVRGPLTILRGLRRVRRLDVVAGIGFASVLTPRLRLALLDVWVQYGSSEITNLFCGGCRDAEVRDLWIPSSFRPQSAQEPFPCFRASPGCYKIR